MCNRRRTAAFTLLEVLVVVALVGVLGGMIVVSFGSNPVTQLQAAAGILGRDIEYAHTLAVSNADSYKITFDLALNRWVLTHSGTNYALANLPVNSLHLPRDPATQQILVLADLPAIGNSVKLHAVWALAGTPQTVTNVEFQPLGNTTRTEPTVIWLTAGTGSNARYIAVRVNPVTGLYWVENLMGTAPTAAVYGSSPGTAVIN